TGAPRRISSAAIAALPKDGHERADAAHAVRQRDRHVGERAHVVAETAREQVPESPLQPSPKGRWSAASVAGCSPLTRDMISPNIRPNHIYAPAGLLLGGPRSRAARASRAANRRPPAPCATSTRSCSKGTSAASR